MTDTPKPAQPKGPQLPQTVMEIIAMEEAQDTRFARIAFVSAIVLHVIFFLMNWNFLVWGGDSGDHDQQKNKIYVVKQVKFKQPPKREMQQIPKPKTKKVPIPDPTPDEPEPIRDEDPDDDLDFDLDDSLILGIPDAPPAPEPEGPVRFVVGGNITEPERLSGPNPTYPEAARRARIQGVVVLECTIGKDGRVNEVNVLRGLPLGLTESAENAVRKWRFKASTLNGKPVEVLYILTVRFNLQ
ncbi:MAG: energy transducer TonB [Thermoanaerobaculales bacterium]|nr:energy transducer TonB [Thermoanaerobaculales bacterium]